MKARHPTLRGLNISSLLLSLAGASAFSAPSGAAAQAKRGVLVKVQAVEQPVPGASISAHDDSSREAISALTGSGGTASLKLADGRWIITASRSGLRNDSVAITIVSDTTVVIALVPSGMATLAPVVVGTSRVMRRLSDEPERVEILAGEDVDEKTVMRPSDPTRLLSEMPGVRVQTTSPGLGGAGLRLRGLRGRYTLVLSDGLPLYGSVQGIGFMDLPPLDLKQVEVIKGAAGALYGPEAVGGVVNLISRTPPRDGTQTDVVGNVTSRNGEDLSAWTGGTMRPGLGYTLLGGAHRQSATDVNSDSWADIPGFKRGEARLRLIRTDTTARKLSLTTGLSSENRTGGTVDAQMLPIEQQYRLAARTTHADAGGQAIFPSGSQSSVTLRGSIGAQWQHRQFGDSTEIDRRTNSIAEALYSAASGYQDIVAGLIVSSSALSAARLPLVRYNFTTVSAFVQDTYSPFSFFSLSATGRVDHNSRYGSSFSPRVSSLTRLGAGWSFRASGGIATSNPTPLVEEADAVGLSRVRGFAAIRPEQFRDVSADLNGRIGLTEINVSVFASSLIHPVSVIEGSPEAGTILLTNSSRAGKVKGAEFFAVYNVEPIAITALYSITDATEWSPLDGQRIRSALVPRHAGGIDIAFEEDESGTRAGVEIFYTGRQHLEHDPYRTEGRPYTTVGILGEQRLGKITVFVNVDNVTDVRQTRFDPLLLPRRSPTGRWTTDAWAPLEGRIINVGGRFRF